MADQIYIVDELAVGPETVTVIDDGTGIDWLAFSNAIYASPTDIRLGWTTEDGSASSASGFFFITGNDGRRLVVEGLIENVRATNGVDYTRVTCDTCNASRSLFCAECTRLLLPYDQWPQPIRDKVYIYPLIWILY